MLKKRILKDHSTNIRPKTRNCVECNCTLYCNSSKWTLCNRKGGTAKKFFFELMLFLDIFQYKNHIWQKNKNFIFLAVSPFLLQRAHVIMRRKRLSDHEDLKETIINIHESNNEYEIVLKVGDSFTD